MSCTTPLSLNISRLIMMTVMMAGVFLSNLADILPGWLGNDPPAAKMCSMVDGKHNGVPLPAGVLRNIHEASKETILDPVTS